MTKTVIKYKNGEQVSKEEVPIETTEIVQEEVQQSTPLPELAKDCEKKPLVNAETKRDRFLRLASRRTQMVLDKIRILRNCSNRSQYEWTHDEALHVVNEIKLAVNELEEVFTKGRRRMKFSFQG